MKTIIVIITTFFLALFSGLLLANNMYQADVVVESKSQDARNSGIQRALKSVLANLAGDAAVIELEEIKNALKVADEFVDSYSYHRLENRAKTEKPSGIILRVNFMPEGIAQLMHEAGQTIWDQKRPEMLVWLVQQTATGKEVLSQRDSDKNLEEFSNAAKARGIPLLLPVMDITDLRNISADDIWYSNLPVILQASSRYPTEAILVGRVSVNSRGIWKSTMSILLEDDILEWDIIENSLPDLMVTSANSVFDKLTAHLAREASIENNDLTITVFGINNKTDYDNMMQYFKSVTNVRSIEPVGVEPNRIVLKLSLRGGGRRFANTLYQDQKLLPIRYDAVLEAQEADMVYQWIG